MPPAPGAPKTLRWIVTGARGQLGTWLVRRLELDPTHEVVEACDRAALDLGDSASVERALARWKQARPDLVLNAAAMTDVDGCERDPEAARRINELGAARLAEGCRDLGFHFVQVSTDYVFDGTARRPYREDDPPNPLSVYGRTKLAAERRTLEANPSFLVVRTSWLFGPGRNFVRAILERARAVREGASEPLRVVDDQRGRPTWAADLAAGIVALVERGAAGIVHLANAGDATWWEFARAALDRAGYADLELEKITTAELQRPAARPAYSVLDLTRAEKLGVRLRNWEAALEAHLASEARDLVAVRGEER